MGKIERTFLLCLAICLQFGCEQSEPLGHVPVFLVQGYVPIGGDTSLCSTYPYGSIEVWIDFERLGLERDALDSVVWTGGYLDFQGETDSINLANVDTGTFHLLFYQFPNVDSVALHLQQCQFALFVPSAFSPNGDGLNETWHPFSSGLLSLCWEVRSQHGEFIFSSDMGDSWDGEWDGQRAPAGYYIYRIRYTVPPDGSERRIQGWLELYR